MNCSRSRSMALRSVLWPFLRTASKSSPGVVRWFFLQMALSRFIPVTATGRSKFGTFRTTKRRSLSRDTQTESLPQPFPRTASVLSPAAWMRRREFGMLISGNAVGNPPRPQMMGFAPWPFLRMASELSPPVDDKTAKVWDVTSRQPLVTFSRHSNLVMSAAFSPDGGQIVTGGQDGSARVWDSASGEELFSLKKGTSGFGR